MATFTDHVRSFDSLRVATPTGGANTNISLTSKNAIDAILISPTANAAAADILTITNAAFGQATTLTIPDIGVATGSFAIRANGNYEQGTVTNITAGTTQTQGGATGITSSIVTVITGNSGDGIILPALSAALIGIRVQVINKSANAGVIYCPGTTSTNTINGTAGATGVAYAASKTLFLVAVSATAWLSTLSN